MTLNRLQPGWQLLVASMAVAAAVAVPARLVLADRILTEVTFLDWMVTVIFVADVVVHRVSARARSDRWPWLAIDIAAAIPFAAFPVPRPLQLVRLLKLARLARQMHRWQRTELHNPTLVRLLVFLFWMALSLHWLTCGWLALRGVPADADSAGSYLRALYWCVITLATVGYGDITPATSAEMLYAIFVALLGVGVFGYVIGSVASLLANIDPARVRHREAVERIKAFMRYRQIPASLQQRILDYYEYLWEKRLGYDESLAISALPPSLRTDVSLFLNREIIEAVPLFRGAPDDFIRSIALAMRPVIFMPGDYIIRAGDVGDEMYFISRGTVEVVSADDRVVYNTLRPGDFFGEIALVLNQPRSASVRAVDYCDLYMLGRASLERILGRYPDIAASIRAVAQQRQKGN